MQHVSPITIFRTERQPKMTLEAFGKLFDPPVLKSTVLKWERYGVPAHRVLDVERFTGISRHILKPEIYGPAPVATAIAPAFDVHPTPKGTQGHGKLTQVCGASDVRQ